MALYKLNKHEIHKIPETTFSQENIRERQDLQQVLKNSIHIIDPNLLVICEEFSSWKESRRAIDLLCIDKDANLAVIEIKKTEDGGHMELQAIRYAAMVSTMTFSKVAETFSQYLLKEEREEDSKNAADRILAFLEWDEVFEEKFAQDVKIILISADFSVEITTSVLWLLDRDLDIRCFRLQPYKFGESLLLDIQQILPLPEAADYQVKIREKSQESRQSRIAGQKDFTRYKLHIGDETYENLPKRQAIFQVVKAIIKNGTNPEELYRHLNSRSLLKLKGIHKTKKEFNEAALKVRPAYDSIRYFNNDDELFHFNDNTYALSNQWGVGNFEVINEIIDDYKDTNIKLERDS